ncbi:hypothetical protein [Pseudomonas sp. MWU12-2345]|uniref:hypothetical protein n=1 Tax=Pseudomonas sp. MWU12-2345 TaxID=2928689 RepID=UPI00200FEFC2|nr:hypothetical protein [Pseudomonas sp. MWU12-2345]
MMTLEIAGAFLVLLLIFFGLGLSAYVAKTKLDLAEVYLKDNVVVMAERRYWRGNSYNDRMARTFAIGGLFVFSTRCIRRGWLTEQELESIPITLRRWFVVPFYLGMLFLSIAIIYWGWQQF